ncbi:hypothetical protein N7455_006009 [Penicillium solitum]|uniref:uncharacterized protein n=1 Tax=Penicillium solitum TaxID=60172 RepID=UPI0032C4196E|nr:hypothetical protein N7455_006009 [Penicillium solitum]
MTLTWLESGLQDAKSQDNPDSGNTSTVVNGSIQPRPEKNAMVGPKPISNFIKENSGGQPTQDEEDPSSQLLSDSDKLRHSGTHDAPSEYVSWILTCTRHHRLLRKEQRYQSQAPDDVYLQRLHI